MTEIACRQFLLMVQILSGASSDPELTVMAESISMIVYLDLDPASIVAVSTVVALFGRSIHKKWRKRGRPPERHRTQVQTEPTMLDSTRLLPSPGSGISHGPAPEEGHHSTTDAMNRAGEIRNPSKKSSHAAE